MKKIFIHGLSAGILSSAAGIIYMSIYQSALGIQFNTIISISAIAVSSISGCLLMSCGNMLLIKFDKQRFFGWFNIIITGLSFASIIGPLSISLPLDIASPELFPGLAIPMHFFPALTFFAITPFFIPLRTHQ